MADDSDETHQAWAAKSHENLSQSKDAKKKVKEALLKLEQTHADKVNAIAEERRRQEAAAAAAAARAKREQEERARAAFKAQQAADMKAKQDALKARKRGEANALKEATANFKNARRAENMATMKAKRTFDLGKSQSELQNAYIACLKQCRSWFVAVKACEMRLESREKRPASELIVDNVQSTIERELTTLNEARKSLKDLVDEGEKLSTQMSQTSWMLASANSRENVSYRRDKMETSVPLHKAASAPLLPPIDGGGGSPKDLNKSIGKMFVSDCPSQEELLDLAKQQVGRANELRVECEKVLTNCRNRVVEVMAASNASLDVKKQTLNGFRKSLEREKLEADGSLRDAAYRVTMLKMKAQHVPQGPEDEEEMQACQALVKELKEAKDEVFEDWRAKSSTYKIDSFCRNLTPKIAATMFKVPTSPVGGGAEESQNFQ
jgi:hypothetical protein